MPPMAKSRFDYQNNRWACGNAALARRWYDELERANPENVRASLALSTPEQKCIGLPEQKYINDASQKAPETGVFCSGIRLGSDYLPAAYPSSHGVSGACSD